MQEVWKLVEAGSPSYYISNKGRAKSISSRKADRVTFLSLYENTAGYVKLNMTINGKKRNYYCHRVVAIAFIPNPLNLPQINHKNGIKTDNRVGNLEWIDNSGNQIHALKTGLRKVKYGVEAPHCKLTNNQVLEMRAKYKPNRGYSMYKLAAEYGLSQQSVNKIINRKSWAHI